MPHWLLTSVPRCLTLETKILRLENTAEHCARVILSKSIPPVFDTKDEGRALFFTRQLLVKNHPEKTPLESYNALNIR